MPLIIYLYEIPTLYNVSPLSIEKIKHFNAIECKAQDPLAQVVIKNVVASAFIVNRDNNDVI